MQNTNCPSGSARAFALIGLISLLLTSCSYSNAANSKFLTDAKGQIQQIGTFQSLDELTGIKFIDQNSAVLLNDPQQRKIPYSLVESEPFLADRQSLYKFRPSGGSLVKSESGAILYSKDAPENFIARKMRALKKFAEEYYKKTGCYPNSSKKWESEPELVYINPFNKAVDSPSIKVMNGTLDRDFVFQNIGENETPFEFIRRGGNWRDERAATPGAIHTISLFQAKRCADGFKTTEFYATAFDRASKQLTSSEPSKALAMGLKEGKDLLLDSQTHQQKEPPERLLIVVQN